MTPSLHIPELVRRKAEIHGVSEWLVELSAIVAALERRWEFTAGKAIAGGTEAYVCEATRDDGLDAVLQVMVPRDGGVAEREIEVLRFADGDGCVRLLDADEAQGAVLLERLGPSLHDLGLPVRRRHEILCETAQRFWRPAPDEHPFTTRAEKATRLITFRRATLG